MPPIPSVAGNTEAEWTAVEAVLGERGVPRVLVSEFRRALVGRLDGLLLYGSWARGDADADSDLDLLVLDYSGAAPGTTERVSIGRYDVAGIKNLSGTLFGYHLSRDGVVLLDKSGGLTDAVGCIRPPGPGTVTARVRSLTPVLDVGDEDRVKYLEGLIKVARYLLRSALYAEALDQGSPCFSVREIAVRKQDPSLVSVLSSHASVRPPPSVGVLEDLRARLCDAIGPLAENPYADLHALIEDTWGSDRDLSNFATLALANDLDVLPYDELPKVTL